MLKSRKFGPVLLLQCGLPKENPAASLQKSQSSIFLVKLMVWAEWDIRGYVTSDIVRTTLTVMFEYLMIFDMVLLIISSQIDTFYSILQVKI